MARSDHVQQTLILATQILHCLSMAPVVASSPCTLTCASLGPPIGSSILGRAGLCLLPAETVRHDLGSCGAWSAAKKSVSKKSYRLWDKLLFVFRKSKGNNQCTARARIDVADSHGEMRPFGSKFKPLNRRAQRAQRVHNSELVSLCWSAPPGIDRSPHPRIRLENRGLTQQSEAMFSSLGGKRVARPASG